MVIISKKKSESEKKKPENYNYKVRRIPENSVGFIFIFNSPESRKEIMSTQEYKKLMGDLITFAHLHNRVGFRIFKNFEEEEKEEKEEKKRRTGKNS